MHPSFAKAGKSAIPLHAVPSDELAAWTGRMPFLKASGFRAKEGELRLIPGAAGRIAAAVLGLGKSRDSLALAAFSEQLPEGLYRFDQVPEFCGGAQAALAWA